MRCPRRSESCETDNSACLSHVATGISSRYRLVNKREKNIERKERNKTVNRESIPEKRERKLFLNILRRKLFGGACCTISKSRKYGVEFDEV